MIKSLLEKEVCVKRLNLTDSEKATRYDNLIEKFEILSFLEDCCAGDWNTLTEEYSLPEHFIREFDDKFSFMLLSKYQKLSDRFISDYADKLNWYVMSRYQELSTQIMQKFSDELDWYRISKYQNLSEEFMSENADKLDWCAVSKFQRVPSRDFIREFSSKFDWCELTQKCTHKSKDFIREFANYLDWKFISRYYKLDKAFINEFIDKVDWGIIKQKYPYTVEAFPNDYICKSGITFEISPSGFVSIVKIDQSLLKNPIEIGVVNAEELIISVPVNDKGEVDSSIKYINVPKGTTYKFEAFGLGDILITEKKENQEINVMFECHQ